MARSSVTGVYIYFRRSGKGDGRLLVGHRKSTWKLVWYMPVPGAQEDDDEFIEAAYYSRDSGAARAREPMTGEIIFYAHFDSNTMESSSKAERDRIQKIDLNRLWKYLNAQDPDRINKLEEDLMEGIDRPRWRATVDEARKVKGRQPCMKTLRKKEIQGVSNPTATSGKDDYPENEGDSTYESVSEDEDEAFARREGRDAPGSMRPPRSTPSRSKRHDLSHGNDRPSKRGRTDQNERHNGSNRQRSPSAGLFMSGALSPSAGGSRAARSPSVLGLASRVNEEDPDNFDDNSSIITTIDNNFGSAAQFRAKVKALRGPGRADTTRHSPIYSQVPDAGLTGSERRPSFEDDEDEDDEDDDHDESLDFIDFPDNPTQEQINRLSARDQFRLAQKLSRETPQPGFTMEELKDFDARFKALEERGQPTEPPMENGTTKATGCSETMSPGHHPTPPPSDRLNNTHNENASDSGNGGEA